MTSQDEDDGDEGFAEEDRKMAEWFGRMVALPIRRALVRKLLAGNDTQCFTTAQYRAAYEADRELYLRKDDGSPLITPDLMWVHITPEKHLLSTGLVREVEPGIWAPL